MSKKRTYRTLEQWQQIIEDFGQSGQSVAGFCKQQGLCESRFYIWRKKLSVSENSQATTIPFIEYQPENTPPSWDVELDLGGMVLRLRRG